MLGLLGKKIGMTQIFSEEGHQVAVTVLEVGPCYVIRIRTPEKDGYSAVQLGFGEIPEKKLNKARLGYLKKSKVPALKYLKEIRTENVSGLTVGSRLTVENFEIGDWVDVTGVSKGKGFQGVVKRHHFKGGEAAHGSKFGREAGSIGQGHSDPKRVPKGRKMAGHMGSERVTVQNLKVVKVDAENHLLVLEGAVPGAARQQIWVKSALKRGKPRDWKVPVLKKESEEKPREEIQKQETPAENTQGSSSD